MMKDYILSFVFVSLVLLNLGCKKSPTEIDKPPIVITPPSLELSVDGVSCTEAWIKVKKLNDTTFLPISVKINEKEFFHGFLAAADTVLFVDSLTPNTTYTVKGIILDTLQTAKELKVTTLPTTSHNFTWQTFEFGEHSSSVLNDVAIIDENNIWAVGEIYMNDSLGNPDPIAYNVIHWNGTKWEVNKISVLYNGNQTVAPLEGVFALPTGEIIFSSGLPYLPQTNGWKLYHLWDMGILNQNDGGVTKIWGTSINDLYFVGRKGTIVHYDGKNWQKIESETDVDLTDVWGSPDGAVVWVSGYMTGKTTLIKIQLNKATKIFEGSPYTQLNGKYVGTINSVWSKRSDRTYYLNAGWGEINIQNSKNEELKPRYLVNNIIEYMYRLRGLDYNDIYVAGEDGKVGHFDGQTYGGYSALKTSNAAYYSLAVKNRTLVAVGEKPLNSYEWQALILLGKR